MSFLDLKWECTDFLASFWEPHWYQDEQIFTSEYFTKSPPLIKKYNVREHIRWCWRQAIVNVCCLHNREKFRSGTNKLEKNARKLKSNPHPTPLTTFLMVCSLYETLTLRAKIFLHDCKAVKYPVCGSLFHLLYNQRAILRRAHQCWDRQRYFVMGATRPVVIYAPDHWKRCSRNCMNLNFSFLRRHPGLTFFCAWKFSEKLLS